jgi:hypothetical protein
MLQKKCSNCGESSHPRVKVCKCGNKFVFKPKKKEKYQSVSWQELKKGDIIKAKGGPVWVNSLGIKISMGYKGKYCVEGVDQNGILAYGIEKNGGFCHIWMKGKAKKDNGLIKLPHKIKKIK